MKYLMVFVVVAMVAMVAMVGSCATASESGDDVGITPDATIQGPDAPSNPFADARVSFPDGSVPKDAPLISTPDASFPADATPTTPDAGGGGLFCDNNSQCGPGTCCFISLCVPGTPDPIFGCLPD